MQFLPLIFSTPFNAFITNLKSLSANFWRWRHLVNLTVNFCNICNSKRWILFFSPPSPHSTLKIAIYRSFHRILCKSCFFQQFLALTTRPELQPSRPESLENSWMYHCKIEKNRNKWHPSTRTKLMSCSYKNQLKQKITVVFLGQNRVRSIPSNA